MATPCRFDSGLRHQRIPLPVDSLQSLDVQEIELTTITIELPDDVARSAQQAGLLNGQALASVVRELVRERAARKLQRATESFDARPVDTSELTVADIQHAIDAARGR